MAGSKGQVNIGPGTFAPGTKVHLNERVGDGELSKGGKSATIGKDGTASFASLDAGRQFWLVGEDEHGRQVTVAATAKAPGEPPRRPIRNPEDVRNELRDRALDQGSQNAPVEGMRSSASQGPKPPDQAQRNRETMESALRTAEALKKQNLEGATVDPNAAAQAGLVVVTNASGAAVRPTDISGGKSERTGQSGAKRSGAAKSAASKKAAATRRRNARSRSAKASKK